MDLAKLKALEVEHVAEAMRIGHIHSLTLALHILAVVQWDV